MLDYLGAKRFIRAISEQENSFVSLVALARCRGKRDHHLRSRKSIVAPHWRFRIMNWDQQFNALIAKRSGCASAIRYCALAHR